MKSTLRVLEFLYNRPGQAESLRPGLRVAWPHPSRGLLGDMHIAMTFLLKCTKTVSCTATAAATYGQVLGNFIHRITW